MHNKIKWYPSPDMEYASKDKKRTFMIFGCASLDMNIYHKIWNIHHKLENMHKNF